MLTERGVDRLVALPLFPHYSIATTQSAFGFLFEAMERGVASVQDYAARGGGQRVA